MDKHNLNFLSNFSCSLQTNEIKYDRISFSADDNFLAIYSSSSNTFSFFLVDSLIKLNFTPFHEFQHESDEKLACFSFVEFDPISFTREMQNSKDIVFFNTKRRNIIESMPSLKTVLVLAMRNKQNPVTELQLFSLSSLSILAKINIQYEIKEIQTDKILPYQLFFINSKDELIKYNFHNLSLELVAKQVKFFEQIGNGSLIISTEEGMKYYDSQSTLVSILPKGIDISQLSSLYNSPNAIAIGSIGLPNPYYIIFNPNSNKPEPIYPLYGFNVAKTNKFSIESFCFPKHCIFIGSNSSNRLFIIGSNGEFSEILSYIELKHVVTSIHMYKSKSNPALLIFGNDQQNQFLSVLKFSKVEKKNHSRFDIRQNGILKSLDKSYNAEDDRLNATMELIRNLPRASDPKNVLNPLKPEIAKISQYDAVLKDIYESNIEASALASNLEKKKIWIPYDGKYYLSKMQSAKSALEQKICKAEKRLSNEDQDLFLFRFTVRDFGPNFPMHSQNKR